MKNKKLTFSMKTTDFSIAKVSNGFRDPLFAFVIPPKQGGIIEPITGMVYCRESLCEYIRQDVRGITDSEIDLNKLHMVIYRRVYARNITKGIKIFQNQVLAGQKIVNVLEKHHGWPLTKIYPVSFADNQKDDIKNSSVYYIVAGKRWIKAPAMLSLYTLLFRIAAAESDFPFKHRIRSMKSLFSVLDDVTSKRSYSEFVYYKAHNKYWQLVLSNYRKLFGQRTTASLYSPKWSHRRDGWNSQYFSEGINSLCDGDTKDKVLSKTFEEIRKKHDS